MALRLDSVKRFDSSPAEGATDQRVLYCDAPQGSLPTTVAKMSPFKARLVKVRILA